MGKKKGVFERVWIIFARMRETAIRNRYYDNDRGNYSTKKVFDLTDLLAESE
jgi:hypothetical protein